MADTDLHDQLDRLARTGSDGLVPAPAAELRRRGRTRARRRTAVLATTLATAAVLTGAAVVGIDRDGGATRPLAAAPATTAPVEGAGPAGSTLTEGESGISAPAPDTGPPVDPAVLLTVPDLPDLDGRAAGWGEVAFRTDTPDGTLPCALGVTTVLDENLPGVTRAFETSAGDLRLMQEIRRYPAEASTADAVAAAATRLGVCADDVTIGAQGPYGLSAQLGRRDGGDTSIVELVVAGRGTTVVALYAQGRGVMPARAAVTDLMATALDRAAG